MGLLDAFKKKEEEVKVAAKDVATLAKEVFDGLWGKTDVEIKEKLTAAGYKNYEEVKAQVDRLKKAAEDAKRIAEEAAKAAKERTEAAAAKAKKAKVEEIAKEVIQGKWGNGQERKDRLTAAGYDYSAVQGLVNKMLQ